MAVQEHADSRENNLGCYAVLILHVQPRGGIERRRVHIFPRDLLAQILQWPAGADGSAVSHGEQPVDHQGRAQIRRGHLIGYAVAEFRIDIQERALAFDHMGVGGNQTFRQHGFSPDRLVSMRVPCVRPRLESIAK
jgi:hypothetical protein